MAEPGSGKTRLTSSRTDRALLDGHAGGIHQPASAAGRRGATARLRSRASRSRMSSHQVGKVSIQPLSYQLFISALRALLGTGVEKDLQRRLGEHHGAHVAPIRHQPGGRACRRCQSSRAARTGPDGPPPGRRPCRPSRCGSPRSRPRHPAGPDPSRKVSGSAAGQRARAAPVVQVDTRARPAASPSTR